MGRAGALSLNALMCPEDLAHPTPSSCVFARTGGLSDCVLRLENAVLCQGCRDFYYALGTGAELESLCRIVDYLKLRFVWEEDLTLRGQAYRNRVDGRSIAAAFGAVPGMDRKSFLDSSGPAGQTG